MAGTFDPNGLKKYLSNSSVAQKWNKVVAAVAQDDEAAVDSALVDAGIHELFQFDTVPSGREVLQQRFDELRNATTKQLRHARLGSNAEAVRAGLEKLAAAGTNINPTMSSVWQRYFHRLTAHEAEKIERVTSQVLASASPVGAVEAQDLYRRLDGMQLSESGKQSVIAALQDKDVRVVEAPAPDVMAKIEHATAKNIVALVRPRPWLDNEDLGYSAFKAQPEGQAPVKRAELEDAISFYDSRNQQANKDAAIKLLSLCDTDAQLHDVILAYHLHKVNQARLTSFPEPVMDQFVLNGLDKEEGHKLLGSGGSTAAPRVDEEAERRASAHLGLEEQAFGEVERMMERRELYGAFDRMQSINGWQNPVSDLGKKVLPEMRNRLFQLNTAVDKGLAAVNNWDLPTAERELENATNLSYDAPQLQDLQQKMVQLLHNPQYIDRELSRVGLDPEGERADDSNGVNSPPFWSYVLKIMGPTAAVDYLMSSTSDKGFGNFITTYLGMLIAMGLLYWVARAGLKRGTKWPLVVAAIVVLIALFCSSFRFSGIASTLFDFEFPLSGIASALFDFVFRLFDSVFRLFDFTFWLSGIAAAVYAFRINRFQGRRNPASNAERKSFIFRARDHFANQGLTPQSGLIVRYIGDGRGQIMLPPTPNSDFTINGKVEFAGDTRTPKPGDLYLFDGGGNIQAIAKSVGGENSLLTTKPKELTQ